MLQYTDRKGVARLNIMNVITDDAGEYTCEAVNGLGKDFTHCVVKIVGIFLIDDGTNEKLKNSQYLIKIYNLRLETVLRNYRLVKQFYDHINIILKVIS
uniref:I-set domain-containing protein n=1 Tax=Heterorhabditis bacteriophora TaxID=37862 RepID=A0A1I7X1H7_HETBA